MTLLAAVVVAWLMCGCAFTGFGLLVSCLDGFQPKHASDYFDAFWRGWAASLAVLLVWHVWFPINTWVGVIIGGCGLLGLMVHLRNLEGRQLALRRWVAGTAALLIGAVGLALMGLRPLEIYDAGLYHLQAIEWAGSYPTVPGLGNLHGRLAFNSSFFLFVSLLGQGPLAGEGYRAAAGLLVLAFLAQVVVSLLRVVRSHSAAPADWLLVLMAIPTLATIGDSGLATTSTDLPVFPLQILIAYHLLGWLGGDDPAANRWSLVNAGLLAVAATTVKLSAAGLALACCALVVFVLVGERNVLRHALPPVTAAIGVVLFAAMAVNGVILSGYPFYPSAVLPVAVDWRVPEALARLDAQGITLAGRQPGALGERSFAGFAWFPEWVAANGSVLVPPALALGLGVLVIGVVCVSGSERSRRLCLLVLPVWVAMLTWFLAAPAVRFAGALLWLAGAIPVVALLACSPSAAARLAVAAFLVAAVSPPQAQQVSVILRAPVATLRRGVTPVPVIPMRTVVTDSGLQLYVPIGTDQAWAGPIPSTPYPDRHLRLRCPDDLACGFAKDFET